jgi:hypothetical protein
MALVIALTAFLAAAAILLPALLSVASHQRHIRDDRLRSQAELLAQAGIDRAIAKLKETANYSGETWHVDPVDLDGFAPADVEIRVESVADARNKLRVQVHADYPTDSLPRARQSREIVLETR